MDAMPADKALRRVVMLVAALNLAYFGVEFAVAHAIGSVSLFADSIDGDGNIVFTKEIEHTSPTRLCDCTREGRRYCSVQTSRCLISVRVLS
jgi:hypothetical protein